MGFEIVRNGTTDFFIDWDIVARLLKSYWTASLRNDYSSTVVISQSQWWNPFSPSLPDLYQVEVDWPKVRSQVHLNTEGDLRDLRNQARYDVPGVAFGLLTLIHQTAKHNTTFLQAIKKAQMDTAANVSESVEHYEDAGAALRFVRDTSADVVMVGAGMLSGGAAVAWLAGGSFFKGYAKFQDKGKLSLAVLEGAGSFFFGFLKLKKLAGDGYLVVVQAVYKTESELVTGEKFGKALASGLVKGISGGIDLAFKSPVMVKMFEKLTVPINVWVPTEVADQYVDKAGEVFSKITGKALGQALDKFAKDSVYGSLTSAFGPQEGRHGAVLPEATLAKPLLLKFAIVNMQQGIGRSGW